MAPYTNIPLSPAELSYLHESLSQIPPVRPDGRSPTQFRPLVAETDILPSANGSARICFADGTEAIVGVKAEVEKAQGVFTATGETRAEGVLGLGNGGGGDVNMEDEDDGEESQSGKKERGEESWVEVSIEIPGMRDDDALPIFLSAMLTEALLSDGELKDRLVINRRFHWRLYVDVGPQQQLGVRRRILLTVSIRLDLTTFTTALVSATTAILNNTSCAPLYTDSSSSL